MTCAEIHTGPFLILAARVTPMQPELSNLE